MVRQNQQLTYWKAKGGDDVFSNHIFSENHIA